MSGDKYILDTNIVLYILNGEEDLISFLNHQYLSISIITEIELLSFPSVSKQEIREIESFINQLDVVELDDKIKNLTIAIRKKHKLKLPDCIIAATAIANGIPLITADKQYKVITDLQLLIYDPVK
jgi:predicted nucleic acid-binding protein